MAQDAIHSRPLGNQPPFKIVAEAPGIIPTSVDAIIGHFKRVAVNHLDALQTQAVLDDQDYTVEAVYQTLVDAAVARDAQGNPMVDNNNRPQLVPGASEWGLKQQALKDHSKFVKGAKAAMYMVIDCVETKDGLYATVSADTVIMQALEKLHMKTMATRLATILASGTSGNRRPLARFDELSKLINMRRVDNQSLKEYRLQVMHQGAHLKALGLDLPEETLAEVFMATAGDDLRVAP